MGELVNGKCEGGSEAHFLEEVISGLLGDPLTNTFFLAQYCISTTLIGPCSRDSRYQLLCDRLSAKKTCAQDGHGSLITLGSESLEKLLFYFLLSKDQTNH